MELKKINLVAAGDSLPSLRLSFYSEPKFLELIKIIRDADAAFTNLERLVHNYEDDVYPGISGGTHAQCDPKMIDELKWMGFDIVSTANNHAIDYMYGGLFKTIENLDAANVPHAGTGRNLAEARRPTYLDTPQGRVALIAAASTFRPAARAGDARRDMQGRPGLNPLRYDTHYVVKEETIETLRNLAKEMGLQKVVQSGDGYQFLDKRFVVGDEVGAHTTPNRSDMEGNLESIREAVRQADWVLFSLHAHEGLVEGEIPGDPAEFIEKFARTAIDAGAHAVLGHGPLALRGIEIRNGRPIFYSLGAFINQMTTTTKLPVEFYEKFNLDPYRGTPSDAYDAWVKNRASTKSDQQIFEHCISVIPSMTFEGERLKELKLYPVEMGNSALALNPLHQRYGRPMLAESGLAEKILELIQRRSKPYGTEIIVKDSVGIVTL